MSVTRRKGVTAMAGEFNMGGGQLPRKGKRGLLSFVFSTDGTAMRYFGRAPVSMSVVDAKGGYGD